MWETEDSLPFGFNFSTLVCLPKKVAGVDPLLGDYYTPADVRPLMIVNTDNRGFIPEELHPMALSLSHVRIEIFSLKICSIAADSISSSTNECDQAEGWILSIPVISLVSPTDSPFDLRLIFGIGMFVVG